MKITRKQLKSIISKELSSLSEAKKKSKKTKKDADYGNETHSDAWSGGDNLVAPVDWEKEMDMIDESSTSFKLSASALRKLIREELSEITHPYPVYEEDGEEEGEHYRDNEEEDEKHLKDLEKDIRYDKDHVK